MASPRMMRTSPVRGGPATARSPAHSSRQDSRLRSAQPWATPSISTPVTSAAGTASAMASASAPDPVHRSTTAGPVALRRPEASSRIFFPRASTHHCAISSVSGRGTNTPGPTASSRRPIGAVPMMCCSGSRAARRATSAGSCATKGSSAGTASRRERTRSVRDRPLTCIISCSASACGDGHPASARAATAPARIDPTVGDTPPTAYSASRRSWRSASCRALSRSSMSPPRTASRLWAL